MVQVDGSRHDWLEGRGPWLTLVGGIERAWGRSRTRSPPSCVAGAPPTSKAPTRSWRSSPPGRPAARPPGYPPSSPGTSGTGRAVKLAPMLATVTSAIATSSGGVSGWARSRKPAIAPNAGSRLTRIP